MEFEIFELHCHSFYSHEEVDPEKWNNDYTATLNFLISLNYINSAPIIVPKKLFISKDLNKDGAIQARIDFQKMCK